MSAASDTGGFALKRMWKLLAVVSAVGIVGGVLGGGVASAEPAFVPNHSTDWIRIGGSDTTYGVLTDLSNLYNGAIGCIQTGNPQPVDGTCFDTNPGLPGIQPQFQADGNGVPTDSANTDRDVAFNYYPIGSGGGLRQLGERGLAGVQVIDIARSSRAPRAQDADGIRYFAFAKDAVPWVRFPGATAANVDALTPQQLLLVFSGCAANATNPQIDLPANGGNNNGVADWGDIGGVAGQPLIVWSVQEASGTRGTFDGFLGSGANSTNCIPNTLKDNILANGERKIFENDASPIRDASLAAPGRNNLDCPELAPGVNCAERSIWFYSYGPWNKTGGQTSILGGINFGAGGKVFPTPESILDDSFPYSRFVYNAIRSDGAYFNQGLASNAVRNFVAATGFLCKPNSAHAVNPLTGVNYGEEVDALIADHGFVGIPVGPTGKGLAPSKCRAYDSADI